MKILVINTGSSSIKYRLFEMDGMTVLASGLAEKIGEHGSRLIHRRCLPGTESISYTDERPLADHQTGLRLIADRLIDSEQGVIRNSAEIDAVGHRVVHGGESFRAPAVIDDNVIATISENTPLAPLHNPANLTGIAIARSLFPGAVHVAVFDTAFHQSLPAHAFLYALPFELYEKHKIRRYGFHGTSHAYVAQAAAAFLTKPLERLNLITLHLGNGASMAAIRNGVCVDTSMGMTPLEGLVMGTRSGDLDPAVLLFLGDRLGLSLKQIDHLLNRQSGLKGLCGTNDMREVLERRRAADRQAAIAVDLFTYRVKKYIGAYTAVLGGADAVVFTAGIGENAAEIRAECCAGLHHLGILLDPARNGKDMDGPRAVHHGDRSIPILVIPTNEALRIAQETQECLK